MKTSKKWRKPLFRQPEPAAPHERRASAFRCKTQTVFQQVFPRFFQKRQGGRAERRQWRKKRGGSPVSKGVEGSRFSGDAQRPLRTARGAGSPPHGAPKGGRAAPRMKPPTGSRGRAPAGSPPHIKPSKPPPRGGGLQIDEQGSFTGGSHGGTPNSGACPGSPRRGSRRSSYSGQRKGYIAQRVSSWWKRRGYL